MYLRTEVQHLIRPPLSGGVLFLLGVRLLPLAKVALVPAWAARLRSVLETLDPDTAGYKELDVLGPMAAGWLRDRGP